MGFLFPPFTFLLRNHARTYTPLPASVIGHVADMTAESWL